jgi:putative nucleotidyltransferase with HDIG domain
MNSPSFNNEEILVPLFEELDVTSQDRTVINGFLQSIKDKDLKTYEHSIRVGLLTAKIDRFMHLEPKALLFAGLLHDLGKIKTPLKTLNKTKNWSKIDLKIIKQHVLAGYKILKDEFDFTAEIILRHHRFQENAYPQKLPPSLHKYSSKTKDLILFYARLLTLADVYDALHRENEKFGKNRKLTGIEIKKKMLELNSDKQELVKDLYKAKILF